MLKIVISPEWPRSIDPEEIERFNKERGRIFLSTVNYRNLGGYTMDLYGSHDGKYPIYDARSQNEKFFRLVTDLNLAFGQPAVIGKPTYHDWTPRTEFEPGSIEEQMDRFYRSTHAAHDNVMGAEKIVLPLRGVEIIEDVTTIQQVAASRELSGA